MRRAFFSLLAMCLCGTVLTGCHLHTHGVCDCDIIDPCYTRAPWAVGLGHDVVGVPVSPSVEDINSLPKVEKKKL